MRAEKIIGTGLFLASLAGVRYLVCKWQELDAKARADFDSLYSTRDLKDLIKAKAQILNNPQNFTTSTASYANNYNIIKMEYDSLNALYNSQFYSFKSEYPEHYKIFNW